MADWGQLRLPGDGPEYGPGICQIDPEGAVGEPCCDTCTETCKVVFTWPEYVYTSWILTGMTFDPERKLLFLSNASGFDPMLIQVDPEQSDLQAFSSIDVQIAPTASTPSGLVAAGGALYVTLNLTNLVVRVDPDDWSVRALASGAAATRDGQGGAAGICHPAGITTDGTSLFVGEALCSDLDGRYHGHAIRQIDLDTEEVTTLTGPGPKAYMVEGIGTSASVNWPAAMVFEPTTRSLFVADQWDNVILQVD